MLDTHKLNPTLATSLYEMIVNNQSNDIIGNNLVTPIFELKKSLVYCDKVCYILQRITTTI